MIRLAIVGYGKMGKEIETCLDKNKFILVGKYDIDNPVQDNLNDKPDVAIEFSTPDAALKNVEFLSSQKVNVVCGTTGWYDRLNSFKKIIEMYDNGFVYASNFSIGMNIFFDLMRNAGKAFSKFGQYDFAVEEIHHKHKLDKPSGTALRIMELLNGKKDKISSVREGNKFGDHKVVFDSDADTITLEHSAKSRKGFAEGALMAAEFIHGRKGFFRFEDVISEQLHK